MKADLKTRETGGFYEALAGGRRWRRRGREDGKGEDVRRIDEKGGGGDYFFFFIKRVWWVLLR